MSLHDRRNTSPNPKNEPKAEPPLQVLLRRLTELRELINKLPVPARQQRQLTYGEAIGWFTANRPGENAATRGAILRASLPGDRVGITLAFLDDAGQMLCDSQGRPCASQLTVDELDEELADAFGDTPLLIIN